MEIAISLLFVNFSCRDFVRSDDIEMLEELQKNSKLRRNSKVIWFFQVFGPDGFNYTIISTVLHMFNFIIFQNFFVSSSLKSVANYGVTWMKL